MDHHSPAFVFNTHPEAEQAIHTLSDAGFDMKQLSLIGKGYHTEEHPVGFYTLGDRMKSWGGAGAFWGGIWGLLLAPAVFFIPGLGLLALAGPVVSALVGGLEGAVVVGGLSALGAVLFNSGIPEHQIIRYEAALKVDKYLLLVHGSEEQQKQAHQILNDAQARAAA